MAYRNIRDFLTALELAGELHRIKAEVDPLLEIAEITSRMSKIPGGGRALFFEKVKGSAFPVATNLFGSFRRVALALEVHDLTELSGRMESQLAKGYDLSAESRPALGKLLNHSEYLPQEVHEAPCQQVVEREPDLTCYPFLKNWPSDGAPAGEG